MWASRTLGTCAVQSDTKKVSSSLKLPSSARGSAGKTSESRFNLPSKTSKNSQPMSGSFALKPDQHISSRVRLSYWMLCGYTLPSERMQLCLKTYYTSWEVPKATFYYISTKLVASRNMSELKLTTKKIVFETHMKFWPCGSVLTTEMVALPLSMYAHSATRCQWSSR